MRLFPHTHTHKNTHSEKKSTSKKIRVACRQKALLFLHRRKISITLSTEIEDERLQSNENRQITTARGTAAIGRQYNYRYGSSGLTDQQPGQLHQPFAGVTSQSSRIEPIHPTNQQQPSTFWLIVNTRRTVSEFASFLCIAAFSEKIKAEKTEKTENSPVFK